MLAPDATVAQLTDSTRTLAVAGAPGQWAFPAADTLAGAKYAARRFLRRIQACPTRSRGRLETRLAIVLAPFVAACVLALALQAWWPVELALLMLAVGVVLATLVYHRLLPVPAQLGRRAARAPRARPCHGARPAPGRAAPLWAALAFYAGAWLLAQVLGHALLPLARLSYGEDGGELGRAGPGVAALVLVVAAAAGSVAWATQPPIVRLQAGIHQGPLVLDHSQRLIGGAGGGCVGRNLSPRTT